MGRKIITCGNCGQEKWHMGRGCPVHRANESTVEGGVIVAILKVVGRKGQVLKECTVNGATTFRYMALHVADELGIDPESGDFYLAAYPSMVKVPDDEIIADLDGKKVLFCRSDEP